MAPNSGLRACSGGLDEVAKSLITTQLGQLGNFARCWETNSPTRLSFPFPRAFPMAGFNSWKCVLSTFALVTSFAAPVAKADSVLELFTSHGCYSCPPAEALLTELLEKDDSIIALEFHVDYWNSLVYGSAGSWEDPFSKRAYTDRQRSYNGRNLEGRTGVYTPQAVINGQYAAVGSNRSNVEAALKTSVGSDVSVNIEKVGNEWQVNVNNTSASSEAAEAAVWMVHFYKSKTTDITSGENKGLVLENHNVVFSMDPIGSVPKSDSITLSAAFDDDPNVGCAVLVQDQFHSPILAAAKCPT